MGISLKGFTDRKITRLSEKCKAHKEKAERKWKVLLVDSQLVQVK